MIDKATVDRIKEAADIVEVVSDYVHLTRRGANYMGLCPFHNERTPSFSVNKARNFCYCFSCHKGGSPVNFIMEKEGVGYHEALLQLARKYNITVEERELSEAEQKARGEREAMLVANEWAAQEMTRVLTRTDEGRDVGLSYLYGRGITEEAVRAFRLGYSPDRGNAMAEAAARKGFDTQVLVAAGFLGRSQEGRVYDRFRGRVIFPILNPSGKVVGFGGRDLKGGLAKYINSPESPVYRKSNELYGIFQAKAEIVRQSKCFLVEGYLDVIGMWQAGLKNAVASSGTALTDGQIALIHRFTENITLIYDGDPAGIKASLRGIDMLLRHRMNVKVLLLPDGHDPHSFSTSLSSEEFRSYVADHETDIIRFKTQVLLEEAGEDPQRRIVAANSVVNSIASIPDQMARMVYVQECATVFGMPEEKVAKAVELAGREIEARHQKERAAELRRMENAARNDGQTGQTGQASPANPLAQGNQVGAANQANQGNQPGQATQASHNSHNSQSQEPASEGETAAYLQGAMEGAGKGIAWQRRKVVDGLERRLTALCVKYGHLPFYDETYEEDGQEEGGAEPQTRSFSTIEFVADDLQKDGIWFSVPIYARVVQAIMDSRAELDEFMERQAPVIEAGLEELRRQRTESLANSAISLQGLQVEEKRLEAEIEARRRREILALLRDFPAKMLASHEDSDIRNAATAMMAEEKPLSRIYVKALSPDDVEKTEEERMKVLVARAVSELKVELFEQRYLEKFEEFRKAVAEGRPAEELRQLQAEVGGLMEVRREFARHLGDRTLSTTARHRPR